MIWMIVIIDFIEKVHHYRKLVNIYDRYVNVKLVITGNTKFDRN